MRGVLRGIVVHGEMVKQLPEILMHVEWCCICCSQCQQLSGINSDWGQTSLQKPPHFAAHPAHCGRVLECAAFPSSQGIYFQREWVHSQQPLPWSCSSHSNYSNSPTHNFSLRPDVFHSQCPGWEHRNAKQPLGPSWVATT